MLIQIEDMATERTITPIATASITTIIATIVTAGIVPHLLDPIKKMGVMPQKLNSASISKEMLHLAHINETMMGNEYLKLWILQMQQPLPDYVLLPLMRQEVTTWMLRGIILCL